MMLIVKVTITIVTTIIINMSKSPENQIQKNYILAPVQGQGCPPQFVMEITTMQNGVGGSELWTFDDIEEALKSIAQDEFYYANIEILSEPCL